ncbi:MAG: hypothetical protein GXO75_04120 [Calditrichaeota bacterium]|nr:hypothetical protein [Calditrichota bacterium]
MKYYIILFALFIVHSMGFAFDGTDHDAFFLQNSLGLNTSSYSAQNVEKSEKLQMSFAQSGDISMPHKNKGKAFILSLILPGLGEHYAGSYHKAHFFMASEVTLWLTYAGFISYREWRKQDYKTFAATYAGVDLHGKSDSYFIDVGNYNSIYEYNAAKLRDRNLNKYYRDVDTFYWQWESKIRRDKFDQLRISSDLAHNRSMFVIGAILANHVFSAIDAVWSAHRFEKAREASLNWDVKFGDGLIQPNVNVSLTAKF